MSAAQPSILKNHTDTGAAIVEIMALLSKLSEQLEPVNGINISKQVRIPKGSVSKATRRLITKKLIKKESLPNNKKEVLFRLTPLGRELFDVHRAFDQQMERGFIRFLQKYDADQLQFIVRVLQDSIATSFLDL